MRTNHFSVKTSPSHALSARVSPDSVIPTTYPGVAIQNYKFRTTFRQEPSQPLPDTTSQATKILSAQSPHKMKLKKIVDFQTYSGGAVPDSDQKRDYDDGSSGKYLLGPLKSTGRSVKSHKLNNMSLGMTPCFEDIIQEEYYKSSQGLTRPSTQLNPNIYNLTQLNTPDVSKVHYRKEAWKFMKQRSNPNVSNITSTLSPPKYIITEESVSQTKLISDVKKKVVGKAVNGPARVFTVNPKTSSTNRPAAKQPDDAAKAFGFTNRCQTEAVPGQKKKPTMLSMLQEKQEIANSPVRSAAKSGRPFNFKPMSPKLSPILQPAIAEYQIMSLALSKTTTAATVRSGDGTPKRSKFSDPHKTPAGESEELSQRPDETPSHRKRDMKLCRSYTCSNVFIAKIEKEALKEPKKAPQVQKIEKTREIFNEELEDSPLKVEAVRARNPLVVAQEAEEERVKRQKKLNMHFEPDRAGMLRKRMTKILEKMKRLKLSPKDFAGGFKVFSTRPYEKPGSKIFIEAARIGDMATIERLIDKYGKYLVYDFDHVHQTALHWAVRKGFLPLVEYLIEKGADVDARDLVGRTPIFFAIKEDQIKILKVLLASEADPWSTKDCNYKELARDNPTASHYLARARQLHIVMKLIAARQRKLFWERQGNRLIINMEFNINGLYNSGVN